MSAHQSPPRKPRLSLQIRAISSGPNLRASRTVAAAVDVTSPTQFNTLSNVYATAVDRATPIEPVTAINLRQTLKLDTRNVSATHGAYTPHVLGGGQLPETPLTAQPMSPSIKLDMLLPSSMTATPPMSAGPVDAHDISIMPFTREPSEPLTAVNLTSTTHQSMQRRTTAPAAFGSPPPYVRNRALHSILRNSPLPPPSAITPTTTRRQSLRLLEKEARRVGYQSPLESVIVNERFTLSNVDLMSTTLSPYAESPVVTEADGVLDLTMAYTGDETRDGGQTPGPFEEMRRRMAGLVTKTPVSPSGGVQKRRKEKKERSRKWVWTIGQDEGDDGEEIGGAMAAIRAAAKSEVKTQTPPMSRANTFPVAASVSGRAGGRSSTISMPRLVVPTRHLHVVTEITESPMDIPTPSIETFSESQTFSETSEDIEMSDIDSITSESMSYQDDKIDKRPPQFEMDLITPIVTGKGLQMSSVGLRMSVSRHSSVASDLFNPETGSRRDTPVPPSLDLGGTIRE